MSINHHTGNISFGEGITPYTEDTAMYGILMHETIRDDWTRQLALTEAYDQTYSIFDHDANAESDPMAIIGMHPAEDVITNGGIELLMRELIACRIPELTQTSLLELMSMPRYRLDVLLKDGRKAREIEESKISQLELDISG